MKSKLTFRLVLNSVKITNAGYWNLPQWCISEIFSYVLSHVWIWKPLWLHIACTSFWLPSTCQLNWNTIVHMQVNFLSQIRLTHKRDGPNVAKRLINVYFALFKVLWSLFLFLYVFFILFKKNKNCRHWLAFSTGAKRHIGSDLSDTCI